VSLYANLIIEFTELFSLSEQHEYFMLPALKNNTDFHSKDRNVFTEVLQHALHEGLEIKLIISSGTSWLTDSPAGYAKAQQVIYDWSQAYLFKMGRKGEGTRSLITCVLFPSQCSRSSSWLRLRTKSG
jgi:hypothetical protein